MGFLLSNNGHEKKKLYCFLNLVTLGKKIKSKIKQGCLKQTRVRGHLRWPRLYPGCHFHSSTVSLQRNIWHFQMFSRCVKAAFEFEYILQGEIKSNFTFRIKAIHTKWLLVTSTFEWNIVQFFPQKIKAVKHLPYPLTQCYCCDIQILYDIGLFLYSLTYNNRFTLQFLPSYSQFEDNTIL